jgi:nucleoporin NUP159
MNRSPPHHFVLRLREFPPHLQDFIVTTSTASVDIGLFTRSKVPLSKDKPADKITGFFTMTEMDSDSQRAQLPLSSNMDNTSAIGLALDLSSREKVVKPISNDEIDESATPLPALMALNNEGVLSSWWIVYSESIRQQTVYPGLAIAEGISQPQASTAPAPAQTQAPAFGAPSTPAFGAPSASTSAFGARPATSFGTASGAFGAPSGLGQRASPWGTSSSSTSTPATTAPAFESSAFSKAATSTPSPTFGAPPFGSTSTPAFGATGLPGINRPSPWGSAASPSQGSAFGQPSGLGKPAASFGSSAASTSTPAAPTSGGFSAFASKGGFTAAAPTSAGGSIFGPKPALGSPSVGPAMDTGSPFSNSTNKLGDKPTSLLGAGSFSLTSTFKADTSAKDNESESSEGPKPSFFGGNFGSALDNASKASTPVAQIPVSKETTMDTIDDSPKSSEPIKPDSTTPLSTPVPAKPSIFGPAKGSPTLFGTQGSTTTTPTVKPATLGGFSFGKTNTDTSKPAAFSFGNLTSTPASQTPVPATQNPSIAKTPPSPKIKEEPTSPEALSDRFTEPPLPPDPMSKTSYAAGDNSVSSTETDAPLPPDFIPKSTPKPDPKPALSPPLPAPKATPIPPNIIPPRDIPGGPDDDGDESGFESEGDDDERDERAIDESEELSEEGSGEDVAKDLSPTSEINQTPGFTPQSSFGPSKSTPDSTFFDKISRPGQINPARPLFGEFNTSAPILPPPKVHASPRSPSPVRSALPGRMLRPDASRSVSAPGVASQILGRKVPAASQSAFDILLQQQKAEEQRREELRTRKEQEEKQALVDDEDERMQEFLASDLEATRTLDEFIAHTDYVGPPSKDSIANQVETVYRDINAMIDTLGVNARALKCFIKGHEEQYKEGGRTREDLEDDDDWCLVEIEDLSSVVEKDLGHDLEAGRIKDVADKLETCNDLQKDLIRLLAKMDEVNKFRVAQSDPNFDSKAKAQPLNAEQAAQQHDLRRDFTSFQKLLSEAEEGLTILKAKMTSQSTSNGHVNGSTGPTVEAVMRTITKMTNMAEKRSGDIDILEGHMRRLRFGSATSPRSREDSPFTTPQASRASVRNPGTSSTYSLFYTPDSTKDTSRFQNSLISSTSSRTQGSPPRKKLSGYTVEEKAQIRSKFARKKEVTSRLKEALKKSGTNVKLMGDDDE